MVGPLVVVAGSGGGGGVCRGAWRAEVMLGCGGRDEGLAVGGAERQRAVDTLLKALPQMPVGQHHT